MLETLLLMATILSFIEHFVLLLWHFIIFCWFRYAVCCFMFDDDLSQRSLMELERFIKIDWWTFELSIARFLGNLEKRYSIIATAQPMEQHHFKVQQHHRPQNNSAALHSQSLFPSRAFYPPIPAQFPSLTCKSLLQSIQVHLAVERTTEFIVPWHRRIASHLKCEIDSIAILSRTNAAFWIQHSS